jgi:glycosyltransferase involved in cell wall biosynthesis
MKVVVVSGYYSAGMGYAENCLPKALAALGHEVHLVTSIYNVYGTSAEYDKTYKSFLGPARQSVQRASIDGYTLHRLDSRTIGRYMLIKGLVRKVRELAPQVVHCMEIASLQAFALAAARPFLRFKYFTETHQHMSVVKPYIQAPTGHTLQKAAYRLTRTLPASLSSRAMEKCYAIAPDCVQVAHRFYGVPLEKIKLQSLGTDTDLFRPATTPPELLRRQEMRRSLGLADTDIVCIYSGRLSAEKNPLVLAKAIDALAAADARFHAVFIGDGLQKDEILACRNTRILPFVKYLELADYYRIADIAVWPRQESMSMLDAAACALPIVVSDKMGESERVKGNGRVYKENDAEDLARVLATLTSPAERAALGATGREKMEADFSWKSVARAITADYAAAGVPA